mgnify:CR=1 FL=1
MQPRVSDTPLHEVTLGIDFGTSNSAAALIGRDGKLQVIALDAIRSEMPTALFFASETHTVAFGSQAMQAYLASTEGRLLRSLKSLLGSRLMDEYTVVNNQSIRFFDIVVLFFKELKRRCEIHVGHPIERAMLGRPVHFVDDNPERDALAQDTLARAAREAGFTHISFQLEPIAAAFDYEQRIATETTALVVDIGGGTSDFTVIRLNPERSRDADRSLRSGIRDIPKPRHESFLDAIIMRLQCPEQHVWIVDGEQRMRCIRIVVAAFADDGAGDEGVLMFEREFHGCGGIVAAVRTQGEALGEVGLAVLRGDAEP